MDVLIAAGIWHFGATPFLALVWLISKHAPTCRGPGPVNPYLYTDEEGRPAKTPDRGSSAQKPGSGITENMALRDAAKVDPPPITTVVHHPETNE